MNDRTDSFRIGIDVGGTFTDAALLDPDGNLTIAKVPTQVDDIAAGFADGLAVVSERAGAAAAMIGFLGHGTTVATNAIVQDRLATVALVTNRGFRDMLEIGTMQRPDSFDITRRKRPPLVAREHSFEVSARTGPQGEELAPLDPDEVRQIAAEIERAGVDAVAVCLLFSFVDTAHEAAVGAQLAELLDGIPVSLSSKVAPEVREYVRAVTTTLNAALLPLVGGYVRSLVGRADESGIPAPVHLMQSNGGLSTADVSAELPVALAASGPAAAVIGATMLGGLDGFGDLLTLDVGGTTADVALVRDGAPSIRFQTKIEGLPVTLPQVDVVSVGAGGGSIASVDIAGGIAVGPQSAGARPGPAAYRNGGDKATVTDASVVIGLLAADRELPGGIVLDGEAAAAAVRADVAEPLGVETEVAAAAILRVVAANMSNALRLVSVARGHDPRGLALMAIGGAGPMYCCAIAEEMGIDTIIVPPTPGVTAALGLLASELRHDLRTTWIRAGAEVDPAELDRLLAGLEGEAKELLERSCREDGTIDFQLDMRYAGQAYNLTVPFAARPVTAETIRAAEEAFAEEHEAVYHYTPSVIRKEIVTVRVKASAPALPLKPVPPAGEDASPSSRRLYLAGEWRDVPTYRRGSLPEQIEGPVLVEQEDTTTLVTQGWQARTTEHGNLVLERSL